MFYSGVISFVRSHKAVLSFFPNIAFAVGFYLRLIKIRWICMKMPHSVTANSGAPVI